MQTFLPYPDFLQSALALDKKRCWKQVVETAQIIDCLEGKKVGWKNHPAVKMWVNHLGCLKSYFNAFLIASKDVHRINTRYNYFPPIEKNFQRELPWWLGDENFHRAMRARLIEKDRDFYLPKFPADEGFNGGKYFWPDMETQTFKII